METIRGLNSNGPAIIATALVFPILTTMTFVLRLATKHFTNAPFGADDWLLFAALDIYIIAEALVIRCKRLHPIHFNAPANGIKAAFIGREAASSDDPKYLTYLQVRQRASFALRSWANSILVCVRLQCLLLDSHCTRPSFDPVSILPYLRGRPL